MLSGWLVFTLVAAALVLHFAAGKDEDVSSAGPANAPAAGGANALEKREAALREAQQRKAMAEVGK